MLFESSKKLFAPPDEKKRCEVDENSAEFSEGTWQSADAKEF
jgi:hypothetical protein